LIRQMTSLQIETPRVYLPLLKPSRYKGAYGGRGSAKSHFFAEMVIERCIIEKTSVVCIREVQKSLAQSVKKLLEIKIEQKKDDFFKTDGVDYVYDHDSIHRSVAVEAVPAYTKYMKDGAEVNCDKQKFLSLPEHIKIYGVYEEACVLAIERSLAPIPLAMTPEQAFKYALMKVCTSITSGWFREYAWENHDKVLEFAQSTEFSFWGRFNSDLQKGLILKHIAA